MDTSRPDLSEHIIAVVLVLRKLIEIYQIAVRENQEDTRIWADYALHWAVRRLDAFLPKVKASRKASALAKRRGKRYISGYKWSAQTAKKKMDDRNRSQFHYEHIKPVSEMCRGLGGLNPVTDEAILEIVRQVDIAWITKDEAKCLASHGKERDKTPHAQKFKECGIEFIE